MTYKNYVAELKKNIDSNSTRKFDLHILSEEITSKVTEDKKYREFYGDTSVFKMADEDIKKCSVFLDKLLKKFSENFIPLKPESFHITLTSFNNPYVIQSFDREKNIEAIEKTKIDMKKIYLSEEMKKYQGKKIKMKSYKFDLTTALLIRFYPATEEDYKIIMELRELFDSLNAGKKREINFFLPHVSLAYLNNSNETLQSLEDIQSWYLEKNKELDFEVELSVDELTYQYHTNMGNFIDIYNLQTLAKEF